MAQNGHNTSLWWHGGLMGSPINTTNLITSSAVISLCVTCSRTTVLFYYPHKCVHVGTFVLNVVNVPYIVPSAVYHKANKDVKFNYIFHLQFSVSSQLNWQQQGLSPAVISAHECMCVSHTVCMHPVLMCSS